MSQRILSILYPWNKIHPVISSYFLVAPLYLAIGLPMIADVRLTVTPNFSIKGVWSAYEFNEFMER